MIKYTAKMQHSAETITKLSITQFNTFQYGKKAVRFVIAVALIVYGLYMDSTMFTPILALFIGCVMIASMNVRPRQRAGKIIEQMKGNFPSSEYSFEDSGFRFYKEGDIIPYGSIVKLVEDADYMYLYVSTESAYMVDKKTVSGDGANGLKSFLATVCNKKWERPMNFMTFRLKRNRSSGEPGGYNYRLK